MNCRGRLPRGVPRIAARAVAVWLIVLAIATQAAPADEVDALADEVDALSDEVDALVESTREKQRIPGIGLLVVHHGKVVKQQGYGLANLEHNVPVTADTIFQSGSTGKQFTAALVLLLVEDGLLGLDDPVRKHLGDAPAEWEPITIRMLLSHTAGLGDYPPQFDMRRDYTEPQLLEAIYGTKLRFEPGSEWSYSNLGYITLGCLIGKVTGKFYGDLLPERIFQPAGMRTARVITEREIVPHRAAGYRRIRNDWQNQEWVSPSLNTTADGSLYLSLRDWERWDAVLREGKLLKPASREAMWTPTLLSNGQPNRSNYGFGWARGGTAEHPFVAHGGAWQGFQSQFVRYLNDELSVVVLFNLAAGGPANPSDLASAVAKLYVPALAEEPATQSP